MSDIHNGALVEVLQDNDRVALGVPGLDGVQNILKAKLFTQILAFIESEAPYSEYIRDGFSSRFSELVDVETITEALDQIFDFQSIAPSIAILATPAFGLREFGNTVADPIITGTAGLGANPIGSLTLMEFFRGTTGGTSFGTKTNPTALTGYPKTDTGNTVSADQVYTVEVTDDQARADTAAGAYTFVYPIYYGWVDEQSDIFNGITRLELTGLSMSLDVKTKSDTPWTSSPTNGRFAFMYPVEYGALASIKDENGFETITNYDIFTYDVVGLDAITHSYKYYVLKNDTTQVNYDNTAKF